MDSCFCNINVNMCINGVDLMTDALSVIGGYLSLITLGFLFSWASYWSFRKLSARFQSRKGPPWYQPIADIIKLLGKELFIPKLANKTLYTLAPMLALSSILTLTFLISPGITNWIGSTSWDLIVILYLSVLFSITFIISGAASASPWGKIGASRETALILSVELPFALSLLVPSIAMSRLGILSLSLNDIIANQISGKVLNILPNWFIFRFPFAAVAMFACLLAKSYMKPFGDIPEAEQEIIAGPLTEYGGPLLGIFELARMFRFYVFSAIFVDLYLGGGGSFSFPLNVLVFLAKCFIIVVLMTLIDVINARYRISQASKWYLSTCLTLSLVDVIRALVM